MLQFIPMEKECLETFIKESLKKGDEGQAMLKNIKRFIKSI